MLSVAVQDVVVDGDKTSLHAVASALLQLQAMYGAPSLIRGKGPGAAVVKDMLLRMQHELGTQAPVPGQHSYFRGKHGSCSSHRSHQTQQDLCKYA